jgi:phosphate transport system substrate-binding protein
MNSPPPIVYLLVLLLGGGVAWYFWKQPSPSPGSSPASVSSSSSLGKQGSSGQNSQPIATAVATSVDLDTSLPDPTVIEIDGSVTMVKLVKLWQNEYAQQYPQRPTSYGVPDGKPNGSSRGLKALGEGSLHMAASSRPLKPEEAKAGIQVIPVAKDAVAVVVGQNNPFKGGLTLKQLADIYRGEITNWAEVGGPDTRIRVLNRSPNSGLKSSLKIKFYWD